MNFIFWVTNGDLQKIDDVGGQNPHVKRTETAKVNLMLSTRQVGEKFLLIFLIESSFPF